MTEVFDLWIVTPSRAPMAGGISCLFLSHFRTLGTTLGPPNISGLVPYLKITGFIFCKLKTDLWFRMQVYLQKERGTLTCHDTT